MRQRFIVTWARGSDTVAVAIKKPPEDPDFRKAITQEIKKALAAAYGCDAKVLTEEEHKASLKPEQKWFA